MGDFLNLVKKTGPQIFQGPAKKEKRGETIQKVPKPFEELNLPEQALQFRPEALSDVW